MAVSGAAARGASPVPRRGTRLRYASFESRVTAGILDGLVLFIIASLLVTAGSMVILISSDFEKVDPSSTAINVFWASTAAIPFAFLLYFFIAWAWKGQTVGAAVMQTVVLRSDGERLGVLGAVARVIGLLTYVLFIGLGGLGAYALRDSTALAAAVLGGGIFLALAGILWAAFDSQRRALHDRLAGTIVVKVE
jgi:uncharacterized RDD family membrane protein YckC